VSEWVEGIYNICLIQGSAICGKALGRSVEKRCRGGHPFAQGKSALFPMTVVHQFVILNEIKRLMDPEKKEVIERRRR
jgi:hypothetical protein